MTDLTPEEFEDMVEMAVDEAISVAYQKKVTAQGLVVFLIKFGVNTNEGRKAAFALLKEMNIRIYSNLAAGNTVGG